MLQRLNIQRRLALVPWGSALAVFLLAGAGLVLFQNLTLEHRVRQIMEPYAQLVAVGSDAAIAFEDPARAGEVLESLRANPEILGATLYLAGGSELASFRRKPEAGPQPPPEGEEGIVLSDGKADYWQRLPSGARLYLSMGLQRLTEQTREALWVFGAAVLVLLTVTVAQFALLRRTLVRPITLLTEATERVQAGAGYRQTVPASGTDELARLGQSFNAMMEVIQQRDEEVRRLGRLQRTILDNAAHLIVSTDAEGTVNSFNPAAERMLGYAADEIVGRRSPATWHDGAELAQRAAQLSEELGETIPPGFEAFVARPRRNLPEEREWTLIRKDGTRLPVYLSITALREESGPITGFVGLAYDLTERKRDAEALLRLNRELHAITDCNQILVRATDEDSLLRDICRIICEEAGYCMAFVGYTEHDAARSIRCAAWAGHEQGYLAQVGLTWSDGESGRGPAGTAIRTGTSACIQDFASDPAAAPWREAALQRGYRSCLALPLTNAESGTFGVLTIYSPDPEAFTRDEIRLLEELAADLAFGIVALRTRSDRDRAEEQVRIAATAFEAQESIVITDANEVILRVNRAFTEINGFSADEVLGATPRLLKSGLHEAAYYQSMWQAIAADGSWQGEIWNRRKDGTSYPAWLTITAVRDLRGEVSHYVGTATDITERKEAERQIEHLAFYDLLTGLPNRRLFTDRLQRAMGGSARSRRIGALLFIDLDNFKVVNETCGHECGDQLLIEAAGRLVSCVRESDTIARLGGDEFVAMLEDLSENPREAAAQSRSVGDKILESLSRPYTIGGRQHHTPPSIGATLFSGTGDGADELVKQGDIALYQAKAAGRSTLRFFDPEMQSAVAARANLEADLRQCLPQRQLVLHYQPQVDRGATIVGAEALLRWRHPRRGTIGPGEFIPVAEETGMILAIGQWVLEQACARLAEWARNPRTAGLRLAVNVSALQFRQDDFVTQVSQALASSGAPPARLELELTESLVLTDVQDSIEKMRALRQLGVGFAMDDFGTGFSSLSYLTRLPLDQIKIDQSFVRNLPDNPSDALVAQAILTLAQSLRLAVVAEGVETEAQRAFLDRHGCPAYQGYLFSKPLEWEELGKRLAAPLP